MTAALDLEFGLRSTSKSAPSLSPRQRFTMLLSGVVLLAGLVVVATFGPTSRSATVPPFEGSVLLANGSGNPLYFNLATHTVTYGVSSLPELVGIPRQSTAHLATVSLNGNSLAYSTGPNVGAGYFNYLTSAGLIAGSSGRRLSASTPVAVEAYRDGKDAFFVQETRANNFEVTRLVTSEIIASLQKPMGELPTPTTFTGSLCSPCVKSSLSGDSHFQDGIAVGLNGRLWYLKKGDGLYTTDGKKETDLLKAATLGALEVRQGSVTLATPEGFSTFVSPSDRSPKEVALSRSDLQQLGKVLSIAPVSTIDGPVFLYNSKSGWFLARVSRNSDQVVLTKLATATKTTLVGTAVIQNSLYSEMRSKSTSTKFVRFDVETGAAQVVFTPTSAMKFSAFGSGNSIQVERSRSVVVFNDVAATSGLYVSSNNVVGAFTKSPASQAKPNAINSSEKYQQQAIHHAHQKEHNIKIVQDNTKACSPVAPQNPFQPTLNGDPSASSAVIDWAQPDNGGCPTFELLTQAQPITSPAPLDGTDPADVTGWAEHACPQPTSISTSIEGTPGWECELTDLSRATSYQVVVAVKQADVWKYSDALSFDTAYVFVPPPSGVSATFVQPDPTKDGYWKITDSRATTAVGRPDLVVTPEQCDDGLSPHPVPSGIFGVALTNPSLVTATTEQFDISTHPLLSGQEIKFAVKAVITNDRGSTPSATVRTGCMWSPPNVACAHVRPLGATEASGTSTSLSVSAPAVAGCVLGQGEVTIQYQVNGGLALPCGTANYSGSATRNWPFDQNCQVAADPNEIASGLKRLYIRSRIQMPVGAAEFRYPDGPVAGQPGSSWVRVNGTDKKPFAWPTDSQNIAARATVVQPPSTNPNQFASIQIFIPNLLDPGQDPDPIRIY